MSDFLQYIIWFAIFCVLQSLAINGWHECFREGNIFHKLFGDFIDRNKKKNWALPIFGCVRCESSAIGSITFWCTAYPLFGFHWFGLWVWVMDVFILCSLNYFFYKRL
jgi:hypothetical protein